MPAVHKPMNPHSSSEQAKWFIRTNLGEIRGPFTALQIAELVATRQIAASTPVSRTTTGPFRTLAEFTELSSPTSPPPLAPTNTTETKRLPLHFLSILAFALTSLLGLGVLLTVFNWSSSDSQTSMPVPSTPAPPVSHSLLVGDENSPKTQYNERQEEDPQDRNASVESNNLLAVETPEPEARSPLNFEDVVAQAEKSVCRIQATGIGGGSGFLIDTDVIMTNRHVVDCMLVDEIEVSFPNNPSISNSKLSAKIIYEAPKLDVAILRVPSVSAPSLAIGDYVAGRVRRGLDVVAIGNPGVQIVTGQTIENAVSRGLLSSETTIDGIKYYQASIAVNPGNSGGPILNLSGDVVGMVTLKDTSVEGMAFAVPCYSLREIVETLAAKGAADGIYLERINQEHDARVTVNRTTELLVYDTTRLGEIVGNIYEGITDFNLEVNSAFKVARELDLQKDHSGYNALESITVSSIKKIATSKLLNENTRLKIAELRGLSRELHQYAISPRGSVNSLKHKLTEIEGKAVRIRNELNILLDFGQ